MDAQVAVEARARQSYPPYVSAVDELTDHLWRLHLLLGRAAARFRERLTQDGRRGFDGVAVFDEEVDAFLAAVPQWTVEREGDALADVRLRCDLRAHAGLTSGMVLPLDTIRRSFGLSALEFDALLLCVAAELHPGYGRVYAYLNNDLSRGRPTIGLILEILCANWAERLEARRVLGRESGLFRFALLAARRSVDDLATELTVEAEVMDFVLAGRVKDRDCDAPLDDMDLADVLISDAERVALEQIVRNLHAEAADSPRPTIVVVSGAAGAGRRTVARAVCRELGCGLRVVGDGAQSAALLSDLPRWIRDARLAGDVAGIVVPTASPDEEPAFRTIVDALIALPFQFAFLFVDCDHAPRLAQTTSARVLALHIGTPPALVRTTAWKRALREHALRASDTDLRTLSAVYPFNVGRIYASVGEAARRLGLEPAADLSVGIRELAAAARNQTDHRLDRLAQALPSRHGWQDIVLPEDELSRLKEIAGAVRNRDVVMERWGFDQKVSAGPGVNAIFFGPSGTGKTMAASILAAELGMAIYRVDLSRVVSKYIGETERNLDTLFDEARRSFALLFFDEAEAIFGKRSEVKDAHDRYANIEVAYLLQRMEGFEGVAILATNLRKHMDNAFLRRLQFAVEFPLPTAAQRLRIWRQVWPAAAELGADLDLDFMANHFELSGGHIRNVAMMAAYLACEAGTPIGMVQLIAATRREFQKLGRGSFAAQFGRYAGLVGAGSHD